MAGVNLSLYLSKSDLKVLHIVPGTNDVANGMVGVAKLLAKEQGDAEVVDLSHGIHRIHGSDIDEVWVHGMWLPKEWLACWRALRSGKKLVRMTHGSLSPIYLKCQSPWKKRLVSPIERYLLRKSNNVVASCNAEAEWIRSYEPRVKNIEIIDLKRFFNLNPVNPVNPVKKQLHVLYLGRRNPLKDLGYLQEALKLLQSEGVEFEFRAVSYAAGKELERIWNWCDILVLPTLSENFGLVIAEALERGKRVITTDGAPAWGDGLTRLTGFAGLYSGYDGRLIYLKGYRDGTAEDRVRLLVDAIKQFQKEQLNV